MCKTETELEETEVTREHIEALRDAAELEGAFVVVDACDAYLENADQEAYSFCVALLHAATKGADGDREDN